MDDHESESRLAARFEMLAESIVAEASAREDGRHAALIGVLTRIALALERLADRQPAVIRGDAGRYEPFRGPGS